MRGNFGSFVPLADAGHRLQTSVTVARCQPLIGGGMPAPDWRGAEQRHATIQCTGVPLIKNCTLLRTIVGPRRRQFLMSEVPLYIVG